MAPKPKHYTKKVTPHRPNIVIYRDKDGFWQLIAHITLDQAIAHARRVVRTETGTTVLLCHCLYEEKPL